MGSREAPPVYRFGEFVLDPRAFRLARRDEPLHLEPKALDVLLCLVRRPGELISKTELRAQIWPDVAVSDGALTRAVAQLRRVLDDPADRPRYIETVPTRGYRFIGLLRTAAIDGSTMPLDTRTARGRRVFAFAAVAGSLALAAASLTVFLLARHHNVADAAPAVQEVAATPIRTIAVLPLKNLSGDTSQDYLAEGITQALGDTFSRLQLLGVVSTTSSSRYRNAAIPPTRIAAELGADALIEGAVVRNRERLHVTVALVDGRSGRRIWTAAYDHDIADVFALYEEISVKAAGGIKLATDAMANVRSHGGTVDPAAYDSYLRAMFVLGNRWMAGGCRDAEPALHLATERDPMFAPAYAALAWCYAYPDRLGRDIHDVGPKGAASVQRALALDDRLALAHAVAGTIKWRVAYDPAAAEVELQRALALDSNSSLVLIPAAEFSLWRGDPERGLRLLDRAIQLDPFSTDRHVQAGYDLMTVGRYDAAIRHFARALEIDPQYVTARFWMAESHWYAGNGEAATSEYLRWLDGVLRSDRVRDVRGALTPLATGRNWTAFWRRELAFAEEEAVHPGAVWNQPYNRYTGSWYLARRYARLGQWVKCLAALERSYVERHHLVPTMSLEPLFAPLRGNPRFAELLRRTGSPDSGLLWPRSRSFDDPGARDGRDARNTVSSAAVVGPGRRAF